MCVVEVIVNEPDPSAWRWGSAAEGSLVPLDRALMCACLTVFEHIPQDNIKECTANFSAAQLSIASAHACG